MEDGSGSHFYPLKKSLRETALKYTDHLMCFNTTDIKLMGKSDETIASILGVALRVKNEEEYCTRLKCEPPGQF